MIWQASQRWRDGLERFGTGDQLRVVAADERGCWGRFDLWRDRDDRPFDAEDAQFLTDVSSLLGRGMRRASVSLHDAAPPAPLETGLLVLDSDLRASSGTAAIYAWFRALNPASMPYPGGIPSLVWSTIGRLIAVEAGEDAQRLVRIRVRAADGSWAAIQAARLDGPDRGIVVSVHAAGVDEVLGLVCRAYGLSSRERGLVKLLAQGHDTPAIARQMLISSYTVQDHLKSIFNKLGVHSRLELLTRLFAQAA